MTFLRHFVALALVVVLADAQQPSSPPNVLLIIADDLGYGDVQCYNPQRGKIPTPNMDRLAAQGMRFTDAHTSSGVCSPTRYTLLTGRYPFRTGLLGNHDREDVLPKNEAMFSTVLKQAGYVTASVGKWQPRIPEWRATGVASYALNDQLSMTLAARYSGKQYSTLDNSDINGFAYQGSSKYFTADARMHYRINQQWSMALGVDNLNNYQYWNFHPYPQRTYVAELKFDL